MPNTPLLQIKDLSVYFNTAKVLKNLNYTLERGQTLSVVGESGSGKTVHALSVLRLLPPTARTEGAILFNGKNLLNIAPGQMRHVRGCKISMVFQDPVTSLNPVLTIASQIEETLLAHNIVPKSSARQRAVELLESVEIKDAAQKIDRYPHEFSGGQRQRICIAMALACGPDLLIADEPTTALDVTVAAQIIKLLKKLQKDTGMALIFITHNLALASELGGKILVLYAGQSAEAAACKEFFKTPLHPYSKALLATAAADGKLKRLPAIDGAPPAAGEVFSGCPFEPRCPAKMPKCARANPPEFKNKTRLSRCWLCEISLS